MAKEKARTASSPPGPATIAAELPHAEASRGAIKSVKKAKRDLIRLSIDLSPEDHWVLTNLALLRRTSAKAMAIKLIRQGSERFDQAKQLRGVYAQMMLENVEAA